MLTELCFHLSDTVTKTDAFYALLRELTQSGIRYTLSVKNEKLPLSKNGCLIITDSTAGIACARTLNIPCLGYAPSETTEDLSGAYALFEDFASVDLPYLRRTHAHAADYPAEILSTKRLLVRELSDTDFPALYAMCTEPSTASFMEEVLSDYETEREKHAAYLRNVYPIFDLALWGVYEKSSSSLIGRAGFSLPNDDSDAFSIGYFIDVPYRNRGYAKELIPALLTYAREQGYAEVSARIKKENTASVKALEQCGFPYEQTEDASQGIHLYTIHLT